MAARLRYPEVAPEGYAALSAFGHYVNTASLDAVLLGLVYLRASELNGCSFCIEMHRAELRKHNEPESRIDAVAHWNGNEAFTPRERAALRWTEVLTRLSGERASEAEYEAVSVFFRDKQLVDLSFAIANINAWNRMGIAFQPQWKPRRAAAAPQQGSAAVSSSPEGRQHDQGPAREPIQDVVDDDGGKVATS